MKRTSIKRKSKSPSAKQKEALWELCKQITRNRYRNEDGTYRCYTCDALTEIPQTGHFIPSAACGIYLRYDLRNLRLQCYRCNINLGGNGAEYYKRMVQEVGQKEVDQLFKDKERIEKASTLIPLLLEKYTNLLESSK